MNQHRVRCILLALAALPLLLACDEAPPDTGPVQALLTIDSIPEDVRCLRVTATGPGRTSVRELAVESGKAFVESFRGLPLGRVEFSAEAFARTCDDVTASTIPGWVSDPVVESIVAGRLANVALVMQRNGRAKVKIGFSDEPLCSAGGVACASSSECCSGTCSRSICTGGDAGVGDAR